MGSDHAWSSQTTRALRTREPVDPAGRWWRLADSALISGGVLMTLMAAYAFCLDPGVAVVDPRGMRVAPRLDEVPGGWAGAAAVATLSIVASAGLPPPRASTLSVRSAAGQVAAALAAVIGAVAASMWTTIWTFGPDDPCRYSSCWPAPAQAVVIASPVLLAALSLVAAAALLTRVRWSLRAAFPAAVWLVLVLLLHLLWEPWLLPAFLSAPA